MRTLASALVSKDHLAAFDRLLEERLGQIDLTPLMVYLIDTVAESALIHLAEQFDVMGNKGWNMCQTSEQRRALVKNAVALHRYAGTPWAVKEALRSVGFYNASIQEHVGWQLDGTVRLDGSHRLGADNWANFRVILDIGDTRGVTDEQAAQVGELIDIYKSFRSRLVELSYTSSNTDLIAAADDSKINMKTAALNDKLSNVNQLDGLWTLDGSLMLNSTSDVSLSSVKYARVDEVISISDNPGTATVYNRATGTTTIV